MSEIVLPDVMKPGGLLCLDMDSVEVVIPNREQRAFRIWKLRDIFIQFFLEKFRNRNLSSDIPQRHRSILRSS